MAPTAALGTPNLQGIAPCQPAAPLTIEETEGPYFKAGSPERTSLIEPGVSGTKLVISGQVFFPDCTPVANARLEFWQADAQGQYDNGGNKLRGHQQTDAQGRYQVTTIVPGLYPGRTRHIHVKVQAPSGPVLTTQLFFPGEPQNATDGTYNATLLLPIHVAADGSQSAAFNFVARG